MSKKPVDTYTNRFAFYEQTYRTVLDKQDELKHLTDKKDIINKTNKIKELQDILDRTEADYTANEKKQLQEVKKRIEHRH